MKDIHRRSPSAPAEWRLAESADNGVQIYEYSVAVDNLDEAKLVADTFLHEAIQSQRDDDTQVTVAGWGIQVRMSVVDGLWDTAKIEFASRVVAAAKQARGGN